MIGLAGVFLRRNGAPLPPGCAGHVGWAFQLANGLHFYGSTENPQGLPFINPGDDNGWWGMTGDNQKIITDFEARHYDGYKICTVQIANPDAAMATALDKKQCGYGFLTDNCLDHAWDILSAYGVVGMPLKQLHPSPNDWFALFNGQYFNLQTPTVPAAAFGRLIPEGANIEDALNGPVLFEPLQRKEATLFKAVSLR